MSKSVNIIVIVFLFLLLSGCDVINSEREILRFALEQGFKSGCDEKISCIEEIEKHIDKCLTDNDLDSLIETSDSEYDEKVMQVAIKANSCINNAERHKNTNKKINKDT